MDIIWERARASIHVAIVCTTHSMFAYTHHYAGRRVESFPCQPFPTVACGRGNHVNHLDDISPINKQLPQQISTKSYLFSTPSGGVIKQTFPKSFSMRNRGSSIVCRRLYRHISKGITTAGTPGCSKGTFNSYIKLSKTRTGIPLVLQPHRIKSIQLPPWLSTEIRNLHGSLYVNTFCLTVF